MKRLALPLLVFASLTGCDVATDLASDALATEVRAQYIAQCEGVAESAGIASENVTVACDCSADNFATDLKDGELQIGRARIEEVLKICVQKQLGAPGDAPAENING
ncbi:hypothetical protein [Erythrobacter rubeus]|uniref:Lipoprotein n=1 Tax=Erythrobacter rubeus TaxID=2760803 RepID=A0ABR8KPR2_9SPHN|nr:hypothetical protein [Erythrobacter rubeus]MBD2841455.1 hypothetical protein [Erythrobacter rubeus]